MKDEKWKMFCLLARSDRRQDWSELESRPQLLVGGGEILRNDSSIADCRHEVCIARPTRQYVNMNMAHDPSASRTTKVHANIEARRLISVA